MRRQCLLNISIFDTPISLSPSFTLGAIASWAQRFTAVLPPFNWTERKETMPEFLLILINSNARTVSFTSRLHRLRIRRFFHTSEYRERTRQRRSVELMGTLCPTRSISRLYCLVPYIRNRDVARGTLTLRREQSTENKTRPVLPPSFSATARVV